LKQADTHKLYITSNELDRITTVVNQSSVFDVDRCSSVQTIGVTRSH